MRRAILMSAALLATLLLGPPSWATASSPPGRSAPTSDQLPRPRPAGPGVAVLNVGDGFLDVAVGVPREDVGAKADAGAVDVLLGFLDGSGDLGSGSFTLTQGANVEPGDLFGAAITAGDFNNDGFVDIAVGAPGEDVGGIVDAGAVNLFLTTPDGFLADTPSRTLTQGGNAEPGDRFGATLAAGSFSSDTLEDLAVGAPGENVGAIADAGAVNVFYAGTGGLPTTPGQTLTQGANAEAGDQFGAAVDASPEIPESQGIGLAVGAPGENVGAIADAGAVNVFTSDGGGLHSAPSQTLTQGGNAESGDRFGTALTHGVFGRLADFLIEGLAVGAPGEDLGAVADAGAVNVFYPDPNGGVQPSSQTLTQGGNAERGDQFGRAVDAGDFGGDSEFEQLVVGAPGENVGTVADAGAVNVFTSDGGGLRTPFARTLTQSGLNEGGDRFGATLAASFQNNDGLEDLVAGIPGEDVGARVDAGAVNAFKGSSTGLSGGRLFTQFVNVESGDGFGAALGGLFPAL